jgi:RimJ/RimL family protein N-acetyltransferase
MRVLPESRAATGDGPPIHYRRLMGGILLEPFGESHLEAAEELVADPDVQRFTRIPVPLPADFTRSWLRSYAEGRKEGTREGFAIVDADYGTFLGLAVVPRIDRTSLTAELGYVVAPAARGRGIATQALGRLTAWAFSDLGALRLELLISVENGASKQVAARCGYVFEGVLRSLYFKQGLREDTEIWSRLPGDP